MRSRGSLGLEEVKVEVDDAGRIAAIGKELAIPSCVGESVGIELFSAQTSSRLFAALDQRVRGCAYVNEYYEASFQQIIDDGDAIHAVDIGDFYAAEIDTISDLDDARLALARHATTRVAVA